MIDRQYQWNIKQFRLDRGELQTSHAFQSFCTSHGIILDPTTPDSSFQNGIEERSHLRVDDMARAMRIAGNVTGKYWPYACRYAVAIINATMTTGNEDNKSPHEMLTGRKPDVSAFRIFGCVAYAQIESHKNAPRATKCVFLGFAPDGKGSQLLRLDTRSLMISNNVIYNEAPILRRAKKLKESLHRREEIDDSDLDIAESSSDSSATSSDNEKDLPIHAPHPPGRPRRSTAGQTTRYMDYDLGSSSDEYYSADDQEQDQGKEPESRAGKAKAGKAAGKASGKAATEAEVETLNGSITDPPQRPKANHEGRYWLTGRITDPPRKKRNPKRFIQMALMAMHYAFTIFQPEPKSLKEARMRSDSMYWEQAVMNEMESLLKNRTWEVADLPQGKKVIGCQWLFKKKLNPDGSIARHKARLVARGDQQHHDDDSFYETFAPVVKFTTMRMIFALATILNLTDMQLDVDNAYLHASLDEEVYMNFPVGFYETLRGKGKALRLKKSIYGLKQAGFAFNQVLNKHLIKLGYQRAESDRCCYLKRWKRDGKQHLIIVLTYVDDLLIFSSCPSQLKDFYTGMTDEFKMKPMGPIDFALGIKVQRGTDSNSRYTILGQEPYCKTILERFQMDQCKSMRTPMETNLKLVSHELDDSPLLPIKNNYRAKIGSLMYAAVATRPDLAYALSETSRYLEKPTKNHDNAVDRIYRYVQATRKQCLKYRCDSKSNIEQNEVILEVYCDASYAGDIESARSHTGYVFMLAGCVIAWKSKRQSVVARSSTEAEYIALSDCVTEVMWMREMLEFLGFPQTKPTQIFEDNQACI